MSERLALHGGPRAIRDPLPTFLQSAGRSFGREEERLVLEAIRSGCLSRNGGTMVDRLEKQFAKMLGVEHAIACSSGTAAVHLTIAALDLEPGDEVIVPPITDIGSVVPILWQNALPVFADVDRQTMVLDPASVRETIGPRTRAILAVHLAGQPCDMTALQEIAGEHGLVLIEDCSQAYLATCGGRLVGTMGAMGCFSLQQSKHITCGEGGLVVTSNDAFARRARLFADKAWPRDSGTLGSGRFLFLAQNYRMSELHGAVTLAQLSKVEDSVSRRRASAAELTAKLRPLRSVQPPEVPVNTQHSYWLYMLKVNETEAGADARAFGEALTAEGVPAWVQYIIDPLYVSPIFAEGRTYGNSGWPLSEFSRQAYRRGLCSNAEAALRDVIAIWWNENYSSAHIEQLADAVLKVSSYFATAGVRA
jgi:perosamine synthetase